MGSDARRRCAQIVRHIEFLADVLQMEEVWHLTRAVVCDDADLVLNEEEVEALKIGLNAAALVLARHPLTILQPGTQSGILTA